MVLQRYDYLISPLFFFLVDNTQKARCQSLRISIKDLVES